MSNKMRVVEANDERLEFDNGLVLKSYHDQRCCEINYLDFEEGLPVGTELPAMNAIEFYKAIKIKKDGFSVKDIHGIPKWVQARSEQNGYYSSNVDLIIRDKNCEIIPKDPESGEFAELFEGEC